MFPRKGVLVKNTQCFKKLHPRVKAVTGGNRIIDREGCHSPVPVGSPRAPRVVGVARVGGLCVHSGCPSEQAARRRWWATRRLLGWQIPCKLLSSWGAMDLLAQEADRGGEPSTVRLESDPGGAQ